MILYLDASALVKRYIQEKASQDVNTWIEAADMFVTGLITRVEVAVAIARAGRMKLITPDETLAALRQFRLEQKSSCLCANSKLTCLSSNSHSTPEDSREGYRDMEAFIASGRNRRLQERLDRAIGGRGAFRYFKYVLLDYSAERERWFQFKRERLHLRILNWLVAHGIIPQQ